MSAIEAAVTGPGHSELLAAGGATSTKLWPHARPTRQRAKVTGSPRRAGTWFHSKPWFARPWFRQPSWRKAKAPVRQIDNFARPILVLAGVQLSNYRCLPAPREPSGSHSLRWSEATLPHAEAMSAASVREGANAAFCARLCGALAPGSHWPSPGHAPRPVIRTRHAIRAGTRGAREPLRESPFCCLPAPAGQQDAPQGGHSVAGHSCQQVGANPITPPLEPYC